MQLSGIAVENTRRSYCSEATIRSLALPPPQHIGQSLPACTSELCASRSLTSSPPTMLVHVGNAAATLLPDVCRHSDYQRCSESCRQLTHAAQAYLATGRLESGRVPSGPSHALSPGTHTQPGTQAAPQARHSNHIRLLLLSLSLSSPVALLLHIARSSTSSGLSSVFCA
jgi:hypothetical protein